MLQHLLLSLLAISSLASHLTADTATVQVSGKSYLLTTVVGSMEANRAILEAQPWWGDQALSEQFATALKGGLGYPHAGSGNLGPLFARDDAVRTVTWRQSDQSLLGLGFDPAQTVFVSGLSSSPLQYAVVVPTDYETWSAGYPAADLSDDLADFDKDGMTNREEYRFGLNPTVGSSVNPITVKLDKASGSFSYTRRDSSLTGLVNEIWTSADLVVWTKDSGAVQNAGAAVGNVEIVVVTLSGSKPLADTTLYVRATSE